MKRINPTILLILSTVALLANTTKPIRSSGTMHGADTFLEEEGKLVNKVKLEKAKENVYRYDEFWKKHRKCCTAGGWGDSIPIRAFKVSIIDLMEALELPSIDTTAAKYKHIRVYLGLNENHQFKLYITPVCGNGKDSFLYDKSHETGLLLNQQRYVLDLNAPCPTTCDSGSPLYN